MDSTRIAPRLHVGSVPAAGMAAHDHGFHVLVLCALPEEYGGGRYLERYEGVTVVACPLDDSAKRGISRAEVALADNVYGPYKTITAMVDDLGLGVPPGPAPFYLEGGPR